jgi:protoporphyrinogen/coproporphyrinogen III oxidase
MGRELGERARTGCRVHAVEPDGSELLVRYGDEEVRAQHVIVAAQAPYAAPLVAPVAERAANALAQLTYGAFLSVAVETSETTTMPYDDVYAMATPGSVFGMFINQAHVLRAGGARRPGGSLMLFGGAHGAAELMRESDEAIVDRFLADLHDLYPETRGVVAGAKVQRWELGNVYASPGRGRLQAALKGPLGAHENLHLAGDYYAELGTMETAARTGLAAAEHVDARIREVTYA